MRLTLLTIMIGLLATTHAPAASPDAEAKEAIDTVQTFLQGVIEADEGKLKQSFDFRHAHRDIQRQLAAMNVESPWSFQDNRETLIYHFTKDDMQQAAEELIGQNVDYAAAVNTHHGLARVTVVRENPKQSDTYDATTHIGLRRVDSEWLVTVVPEFYPIDAWELLTGVEAARPGKALAPHN